MRSALALAVVTLLLASLAVVVAAPGGAVGEVVAASSTPVTGNVTGPTVLGYNTHHYYTINGTGGPAFAANGTEIGNVTFYASVTGSNTTGVSITPSESGIVNRTAQQSLLSVGNVSEVITIVVEITSTYQGQNESTNLTYTVNVVQPFTLSMTLLSTTSATILAFTLTIFLDGTPVGSVSVPALTGKESYVATFSYPTLGLGSGYHTFTASLASEHGLVTFAGGATSYSETFYIPGPAPDYTVWYVAGVVAFFGALFIFVTRVAARRRTPAKK
jgi:hypothetical protein